MKSLSFLLIFAAVASALILDYENKAVLDGTVFIQKWTAGDSAARAQVPALDGWTIVDCDLSQIKPHTVIFAGIKNLSLVRCAAVNADFEPGTLIYADGCEGLLHYLPLVVAAEKNKSKNFAQTWFDVKDGAEFTKCNLSQSVPGTQITAAKYLRFRGCNLVNVAIDATWTTDDCNTFQGFLETPVKVDPIEEEVQQAVDKIAELSFKYPALVSERLKGKVDKETTEGLLGADGKPIIIQAPEGWKK